MKRRATDLLLALLLIAAVLQPVRAAAVPLANGALYALGNHLAVALVAAAGIYLIRAAAPRTAARLHLTRTTKSKGHR